MLELGPKLAGLFLEAIETRKPGLARRNSHQGWAFERNLQPLAPLDFLISVK